MSYTLTALTTLPDYVLLSPAFLFAGNTHIALTRDGVQFEPAVELRNIPYDGKLANVSGLDWRTFVGGSFSGNFITRFDKASVFEPGSTVSSPGSGITTLITPAQAGVLLTDTIDNLRLYFVQYGWQIRMPEAICTGYTMTKNDREEAMMQATFEARQPLATASTAPGTCPYVIEKRDAFS